MLKISDIIDDMKVMSNYKSKNIMTDIELVFFKVLRSVIDSEHIIFVKPRVVDIIEAVEWLDYDTRFEMNKKIFGKHIDFVVCDLKTSSPVLAIELDDPTHNYKIEDDNFKDEVFKESGLFLLRVQVREIYNIGWLKFIIDKKIRESSLKSLSA